ncbi:ankyrin repeat domain-containing protein [Marinifilum sp. D714]|uniref:ankyrin repeat domain-containing protein n=1 Tax=Marinifilum sp. D714 TaxID=2937523 RepID=UPI0027C0BC67|nr:ankyrin repeat domain-containing protein [Marinifilum sp. D714]MDQ2177855.1 ankyrin repeat domain-containing protein [Marinifilum sp. D714]
MLKIQGSKRSDNYSTVYVFQNGTELPISTQSDTIEIDKSKFALRFYNKRFDLANEKFYATRIAAFYYVSRLPVVETGMAIDTIECFAPGTGMATAKNGGYEALRFNSSAHHYLFYQNEKNKRVNLLGSLGDMLKLEFEIDSLNFMGYSTAMSEIKVSEFYLLLFTDRNQNQIVDQGECKKITIRVKDNYKGWKVPYWNMQDSLGQTPLHKLFLFEQWEHINGRQKLTLLQEALSLDSTNPNIQDAMGNTALHYALRAYYLEKEKKSCNHPIELIKLLLNSPKVDVNIRNYYYNNNPLQQYLMSGNIGVNRINDRGIELISLFLNRDDLQLNSLNNVNFSAFDYASRKNWLDDKNTELIDKLKPNEEYNNGASQELSKFVYRIGTDAKIDEVDFYKENIKLCLDYNANPNVIKNQLARTPLTWLCYTKNRSYGYSDKEIQSNLQLRSELVKQLMQNPDIDLNLPDYIGATALHYAVDGYATVLVKTLVSNPKMNVNSQNSAGNTPLMQMIQNLNHLSLGSQKDACACLKELISDSSRLDFRVLNYKGESTLDLIHSWLLDKDRGDRNKRLYPEISTCLEELKQTIENK